MVKVGDVVRMLPKWGDSDRAMTVARVEGDSILCRWDTPTHANFTWTLMSRVTIVGGAE